MLVAGACLLVLLLAAFGRTGAKNPRLDREVLRGVRRRADQVMRDQRFPNE